MLGVGPVEIVKLAVAEQTVELMATGFGENTE